MAAHPDVPPCAGTVPPRPGKRTTAGRAEDPAQPGHVDPAAQWIARGITAISVAPPLAMPEAAARWPGRGRDPAGPGPPPPAGGADRPRHAEAGRRRGGSTRG